MRKPLGLWLGALIAVGVAAALIVASTRASHPHRASDRPVVTPSPGTTTTPAVTSSEPVYSAATAVPTSAPSNISWSLFNGIALPSSATAGPTRVDGAVHAGFAHSPEGALVADAQIAVRYIATPGTGWRDVLAKQIVPGPGVNAYVKARNEAGLGDVVHVDTAGVGQLAGFRFVTYTPSVAVVQIAVRFPSNGQYQVATNTVEWLGGDWKLQLLPDGSSASTVQKVSDLAGFVPWSGVSS